MRLHLVRFRFTLRALTGGTLVFTAGDVKEYLNEIEQHLGKAMFFSLKTYETFYNASVTKIETEYGQPLFLREKIE